MVEDWRDCPFGRDMYEVSSLGRVRSWNNNRWGWRLEPVIMKERTTKDGYRVVNLGRGVVKRVSRLVCEAFFGPPLDGQEAAHKDGDRSNNAASNLVWATPTENASHKVDHGTCLIGSRAVGAVLTESSVREILVKTQKGTTRKALAAEYGVSYQAVTDVVTGQSWRHVPREG